MRITLDAAIEKYGPIIDGKWAKEGQFCTLYPVPTPIAPKWINSLTGEGAYHIYINKDVAPLLEKALTLVATRGLVSQLLTFDGCYMVRDVRGLPGHMSAHSYACAIDINAATNRLGTPGDISQELAACFIEAGFVWGRSFSRMDPMHFSSSWE